MFREVKIELTWEKPIPLSIAAKATLVFASYAPGPRVPDLCCSLVETKFVLLQKLQLMDSRLEIPNFSSDDTFDNDSGPMNVDINATKLIE